MRYSTLPAMRLDAPFLFLGQLFGLRAPCIAIATATRSMYFRTIAAVVGGQQQRRNGENARTTFVPLFSASFCFSARVCVLSYSTIMPQHLKWNTFSERSASSRKTYRVHFLREKAIHLAIHQPLQLIERVRYHIFCDGHRVRCQPHRALVQQHQKGAGRVGRSGGKLTRWHSPGVIRCVEMTAFICRILATHTAFFQRCPPSYSSSSSGTLRLASHALTPTPIHSAA